MFFVARAGLSVNTYPVHICSQSLCYLMWCFVLGFLFEFFVI